MMFTERDHSSSEVISLVVAHVVALLNNYVRDLDPELLRKDYQWKDDDERIALIVGVFDAAQHFVSEYEFFVANDQDNSGTQP
jgi:hypothetical protein